MPDDRDAADRAAYEETSNPLHIWSAVGRYAVDEPLPEWTRRYLLNCTHELWRIALDQSLTPREAAERTARALGLTSQGRNSFKEVRRWREGTFAATLHSLGADTIEGLAGALGINPTGDPRARKDMLRRWLAKVRRSFTP